MAITHRSLCFAFVGICLLVIAASNASEDTTATCSTNQDGKTFGDETALLQHRVMIDKDTKAAIPDVGNSDEDQLETVEDSDEGGTEDDGDAEKEESDDDDEDEDEQETEGQEDHTDTNESDDWQELESDDSESMETLHELDNALAMDTVLEDYDEANELEQIIANTLVEEEDKIDVGSERWHRRRRHRRHRRRSSRAAAASRWRRVRAAAARAARAARARAARARRALATRARAAAARFRRAAAAAAARARATAARLAKAAKARARVLAKAVADKLKRVKEAAKKAAQAIARAAAAKARKIAKALARVAINKAKKVADAIKKGMKPRHPSPVTRVGGATPATGRVDLDMWLLARYASGAEQKPPRQLPGNWTLVKHHKVGSGGETDSMTVFKKTGTKMCAVGFECLNPVSTDLLQMFLTNWFGSKVTGDYSKCGMKGVDSGFNEEFQTLFRAGFWHREVLPYLNSDECSEGLVSTGLSLGAVLADMFSACTNNAATTVNLPGGRRRHANNAAVNFPRNKVKSLYTFSGLPVSKTQITNGQARDGVFQGKRFFAGTSTRVDPATATGCTLMAPFFPLSLIVTPWCGNKHPKVDAVQIYDPEFSVFSDGSSSRRRRASMILTPARSTASSTTPSGVGKAVDMLTFYKMHSTSLFDRMFDSLYGFKFVPTQGVALLEESKDDVEHKSMSSEELDQQEYDALQKQIAAVESSLLEPDTEEEDLAENTDEEDQSEENQQ